MPQPELDIMCLADRGLQWLNHGEVTTLLCVDPEKEDARLNLSAKAGGGTDLRFLPCDVEWIVGRRDGLPQAR